MIIFVGTYFEPPRVGLIYQLIQQPSQEEYIGGAEVLQINVQSNFEFESAVKFQQKSIKLKTRFLNRQLVVNTKDLRVREGFKKKIKINYGKFHIGS